MMGIRRRNGSLERPEAICKKVKSLWRAGCSRGGFVRGFAMEFRRVDWTTPAPGEPER